MNNQDQISKKPNAIVSKLLQIILNLTEEQQLALLRRAEDLLAEDKRVSIRKSCDIPVSYATDCRVYSDQIKNISETGLYIETRRPLIAGDDIIMTFRLKGFDKPLKLKGSIAHSDRTGVGIEFKNISPYLREMIDHQLKQMK